MYYNYNLDIYIIDTRPGIQLKNPLIPTTEIEKRVWNFTIN